MFGAFKPSAPLSGGLLWKIPWRLSATRKLRQRRRLRRVDNVVTVLDSALQRCSLAHANQKEPNPPKKEPSSNPEAQQPKPHPLAGAKLLSKQALENKTIKLIQRWKTEMPTEAEMLPKDKYTMFDKKVRGYRKGVHKLPKWTRVSQRVNPPGF